MKKIEFKNETVKKLMNILMEDASQFMGQKKAQIWKGMVLSIAGAFPEDKKTIYSILKIKRDRGHKESGGAKITRRKSSAGQRIKREKGCIDCPPVATSDQSIIVRHKKKDSSFESVEEIVDAFEGSTSAIRAWAQSQDINIPANVKKPETAAQYILEATTNADEEE